ncbi:MAG: AAA family ATPase [Thermodesulfobacteriota bacterium]
MEKKPATGLILGKFLPPHRGHQYLIDFALNYVERLTIVVGTLKAESIPGELRHAWMREMFPRAEVLHLTDENPQEPSEHPDFWRIWHDSLRRLVPRGPDLVFASEPYGFKLAEILGAGYVPVDQARELVPVSGTDVRRNPLKYWDFLPPAVQPYYVRRVCIVGPESTGKSILARRLAGHYRTAFVAEYARGLLALKDNRVDPEDIPRIARGQAASEDALARQANRVLICDTDLITTTIWSDVLFGDCPEWIKQEADRRRYDLYLLADIDCPWMDDPQRFLPHQREAFLARCIFELESRGRSYEKIGGSWEDRFHQAVRAIDRLLAGQAATV